MTIFFLAIYIYISHKINIYYQSKDICKSDQNDFNFNHISCDYYNTNDFRCLIFFFFFNAQYHKKFQIIIIILINLR